MNTLLGLLEGAQAGVGPNAQTSLVHVHHPLTKM